MFKTTLFRLLAVLWACCIRGASSFQVTPCLATSERKISSTTPSSWYPSSTLFESAASEITEDDTSSSGTSSSSPSEPWIKPRLHNTSAFRGLTLLAALAAAGFVSKSFLPVNVGATVHVLSFGTWFGTVTYTTFIAGLTMFKNLPRRMFGTLQSKLFPKYFALCSATLLLQLLTVANLTALGAPSKSIRALGFALFFTLLNQFYLEPKSTAIMFDRYRLDDLPGGTESEEYKKLKSQFGKLHGMSSLTNLLSLCAGMAHAVFLGGGLIR